MVARDGQSFIGYRHRFSSLADLFDPLGETAEAMP